MYYVLDNTAQRQFLHFVTSLNSSTYKFVCQRLGIAPRPQTCRYY